MASRKTRKGDNEMMNDATLKKRGRFTINLAELEGEGSFACPGCGTMISPDDESEDVYKIVDTKVLNDDLVELIVTCNTCRTTIKLTGFEQTVGIAGEE